VEISEEIASADPKTREHILAARIKRYWVQRDRYPDVGVVLEEGRWVVRSNIGSMAA
jgi:hypothetical protein